MGSTAMPSQSGDPITSALYSTLPPAKKLKNGEHSDFVILASAEKILSTEIKYEETSCTNTVVLHDLKSKYIVLNTAYNCSKSDEVTNSKDVVSSEKCNSDVSPKKILPSSKETISLPIPKRVLYSPDAVRLGWSGQTPVGSGFVNLGNTCYLNSSLQALFHVPAFVNWLSSDTNHSSRCESLNGMTHSECLICAMAKTLHLSQKNTGSVMRPVQIYTKLKLICKHLIHGHQEDAHEFLRYLIEGMEKSYLSIFNGIKLDNYSKETTPLNQIFGGYFRSEVTCLECHHVSTTFQHFQDLLLDIRTASSVDDALESYFSRERLGDGDQAYRCEQCKRRVAATKKFTIERPPKALCIALKRFGAMGGKNSKTISLKQILDISKFRHRPSPEPLQYKLVSMVSHLGPSSSCGHYTAVGQTASGAYYLFDDNHVRALALQNVLGGNPYILMYEMETELPKQQITKKEMLSNGFLNTTNGFSNSNIETKAISSNSQSPSEIRPSQNGVQTPNRTICKMLYEEKPRNDSQAAGPSYSPKHPSAQDHQPYSPHRLQQFRPSFQPKKSITVTIEKPKPNTPEEEKEPCKTSETSPSVSPLKQQQCSDAFSSEKPNPGENNSAKVLLSNTPEKKVDKKILEDECKPSSNFSLVPYLSESSESDGEFVQPKPSPAKDPPKSSSKFGDSANLLKPKGVRIEIEDWELNQNQSSVNRADLHSPAGSTSSGKWSVTSAERDKTPEKQEKSSSADKFDRNDRVPNGPSSTMAKCERWDANRRNNSTIEHLMKTSHRGYGSHVNTWNGGRSEMDSYVEGERNYLKRSHDSYNDDFDRGKTKKMKKYNKDNSNNHNNNRFQDVQNRKNSWMLDHRQKYYRDYVVENRAKHRYYRNNIWD